MIIQPEGWSQVADMVGTKADRLLDAIARGFATVDQSIEDQFRNEQLSGRKADDTGLNIRTGTLHDSIKSVVEVADSQISGTVYNTDAPYWRYHQEPDGQKKRLFLDEYFENQGLAAYTDVVESALAEMAA